MFFPFRAFANPLSNDINLFWCQRLIETCRWHTVIVNIRGYAEVEFALLWFTRNDDRISARFGERARFRIKPQVSFSGLRIRSVAGETVISKDRSDIKVVINRCLCRFAFFRRY